MTIADETRRAFHELDEKLAPEYRAELVDGEIIVNPLANGNHAAVSSRIMQQIARKSAVEVDFGGGRGIQTPHGLYIPDITVVEFDSMNDGLSWGSVVGVLMTVEITSSRSATDRVAKRRAYAAVGIPLYLLVDRQNLESVLFSEPDVEAQDYGAEIRVPFGGELPLPEPFSFTLTDFTLRA